MVLKNQGRLLVSDEENKKWVKRHSELEGSYSLAGVFRGWIPDGFDSSSPRILYVGKATSGDFDNEDDNGQSFNGNGAFWVFAREIARACNCLEDGIPCIAWSNISKLSPRKIKADPFLIDGFEREATASIEAEIVISNPNIVVFVTNQFHEKVVRTVSGGRDDSAWEKSESESDCSETGNVWWRQRTDGVKVLWMRHPQGASKEHREYVARKIAALAGIK